MKRRGLYKGTQGLIINSIHRQMQLRLQVAAGNCVREQFTSRLLLKSGDYVEQFMVTEAGYIFKTSNQQKPFISYCKIMHTHTYI